MQIKVPHPLYLQGLWHFFNLSTVKDEIIPYQVITGNYNAKNDTFKNQEIIPYQVITGNYNSNAGGKKRHQLYHTK